MTINSITEKEKEVYVEYMRNSIKTIGGYKQLYKEFGETIPLGKICLMTRKSAPVLIGLMFLPLWQQICEKYGIFYDKKLMRPDIYRYSRIFCQCKECRGANRKHQSLKTIRVKDKKKIDKERDKRHIAKFINYMINIFTKEGRIGRLIER